MNRLFACALLVAACDAKKKSPPPPAPPAADEACKRKAQDEITKSDRAISNALAAAKLELFAPQFLPTPFDSGGSDPAFDGKHTGDAVTWKHGDQSYTGIYIEPAKEGWLVAKRDSQIFVVKPASWREVTCVDPREPCSKGPSKLLFALPAGATFGGTLDLPAERVVLRLTGGSCPP